MSNRYLPEALLKPHLLKQFVTDKPSGFFLALTLTVYVVFGDNPVIALLAVVPSVEESVDQLEPLFVLYWNRSAVAEDVALIVKPLAVIALVENVTVGAVLSIAVSVTFLLPVCPSVNVKQFEPDVAVPTYD